MPRTSILETELTPELSGQLACLYISQEEVEADSDVACEPSGAIVDTTIGGPDIELHQSAAQNVFRAISSSHLRYGADFAELIIGAADQWSRLFREITVPYAQLSTSMPKSLSDNWYSLQTSGLTTDAQARLRLLAQQQDGWHGPGSKSLQPASLKNFLKFWSSISENAVEPFLTLAPNGHVYAEWHRNWRKHLDLEFLEDGTVYFGLLEGNYINEGLDRWTEVARIFLSRATNPFQWTS